jgi:UDP-N-acetylmuramyl pentapeptide phosphotransferase/UDP-N-acetylglucosamine-1-phosphate transferase
MDLNNLILFFVLISLGIFFYKYFILILNKYYPKLLVDSQLNKPQAFHEFPTSIGGGTILFFSFLIIYFDFLIFKNIFFFEYLSFCALFFLLGFLDDMKINIKPKIRLILMIMFLIILVRYNNFNVDSTGINFLNGWIQSSEIFSLIFISLCFLFIINGTNLIDGYNGLLGFHSLIILVNLFLINYLNGNSDLANFLFFIIISLTTFLWFNFPKAKIFLGDSGSYFLGAIIAISAIKTSAANPTVSPFYFCILLFYLFFEVFFSFFRKLVKKKSPLHPDSKHLHMLLYKKLLKKNNNKLKSNYSVSMIINVIYLILIFPAILMMNNGIFCKYYSIIFFITYIFSYKIANSKRQIV